MLFEIFFFSRQIIRILLDFKHLLKKRQTRHRWSVLTRPEKKGKRVYFFWHLRLTEREIENHFLKLISSRRGWCSLNTSRKKKKEKKKLERNKPKITQWLKRKEAYLGITGWWVQTPTLANLTLWLRTSPWCLRGFSDRPFHKFRALESVDRQTLCSPESLNCEKVGRECTSGKMQALDARGRRFRPQAAQLQPRAF